VVVAAVVVMAGMDLSLVVVLSFGVFGQKWCQVVWVVKITNYELGWRRFCARGVGQGEGTQDSGRRTQGSRCARPMCEVRSPKSGVVRARRGAGAPNPGNFSLARTQGGRGYGESLGETGGFWGVTRSIATCFGLHVPPPPPPEEGCAKLCAATASEASGTPNGASATDATCSDADTKGTSATGAMSDDLVFMRSGAAVKVDEK
jgi:hypothetical protein